MSIIFSNGFSITPGGNFIPPAGVGDYYIITQYAPAMSPGWITIPGHSGGSGLDFNEVNPNTGNAIYINHFDNNNNDNSTFLNQLVGNRTRLTFTQNGNHVTFDCGVNAWQNNGYGGGQVYHDPTFESAPANSMTIVSTSGVAFNNTDPVTISIEVLSSITFTLSPSDFTHFNYGSGMTPNGTNGFSTNGYYGPGEEFYGAQLSLNNGGNSTKLAEIKDFWNKNGLSTSNRAYMFNVSWGAGSTAGSGVAIVSFYYWDDNNTALDIGVVDTNVSVWQTPFTGYYSGPTKSLAGTWNFPVTFTLIRPLIENYNDWC